MVLSVVGMFDTVSLMFCYVFFFFKQKTAYDMRISDWSSDVCSSDLAAGSVLAADARPPGAGAGARLPVAVDRGRAVAGAGRHLAVAQLAARPRAGEIGRASCRERVCPYG